MNLKNNLVSLTGGLGNQLFQLAAALTHFQNSDVGLISTYGAPRTSSNGKPEIFNFKLPDRVSMVSKNNSKFIFRKCIGYNLRMGVSPRRYEKIPVIKWSIGIASKLLISLDLHGNFNFTASKGVGYCNLASPRKKNLLIGYFQSYRWAFKSDTISELMTIRPLITSNTLADLIIENELHKPIFVHVRLGDYLKENDFGIPSKLYYEKAISIHMQEKVISSIWLFSDDPTAAIHYIPEEYRSLVRLIPEIDNSATLTLELLRYGDRYILANSSFSWWGAMLAHKEGVRVIAPYPWFKNMESPIDLIPPNWETLNPW